MSSKLEAADRVKKDTFRGNRYLFIVENSSSMKRRDEALRQTMFDFINAGFRGRMQAGDEFGVWTFNAAPETKFPLQVWTPAARLDLATRVNAFLRSQGYERRTNPEKLWRDLNSILEHVSDLTVVLLTSGDDPISGTPFDREINLYYKQNASTLSKAKEPVTTALLLRGGKFVAYSVLRSGDPLTLPPVPDQGRANRMASAAPQEPTEVLDPAAKVPGATNSPPRRTASIIINKQTISSNRDPIDPPQQTPPNPAPAPTRPTPTFTTLPTSPTSVPTAPAAPTESSASQEFAGTNRSRAETNAPTAASTPTPTENPGPNSSSNNSTSPATNFTTSALSPKPSTNALSSAPVPSSVSVSNTLATPVDVRASATNPAASSILALLKPIGEPAPTSPQAGTHSSPSSATTAPGTTAVSNTVQSPKPGISTPSTPTLKTASSAPAHADNAKSEWTNPVPSHLPNLTSLVAAPHPVSLPPILQGSGPVTAHARTQSRSNVSGALSVGIASAASSPLVTTPSKSALFVAGALFIVAGFGCWFYIRRSRQAVSGSFISRALPRTGRPYNKTDGPHPS